MSANSITEAPAKGDNRGHEHSTVRVVVSYAAAVRPYKAELADNITIAQLKAAALEAFKLQESGTKTFKLFHGKTELSNLSQTVGEVARGHQELALKLEEVIVQG